MTAAPVGVEEPITKSKFAERRGVSPGRVSQWISEGKIDGAALIGGGRDQKIVESVAVSQLNLRLNTSQRFGNGLGTRLEAPPVAPKTEAAVLPFVAPAQKASDQVAEQIARERLEQIQRVNRREAVEEAAQAGRLTDTAAVAQAQGRMAAQMITVFESAMSELASALASKFEIPHRDALHFLRAEFRKVRSAAAEVTKRQAQDLPALVPVEIELHDDSDRECGTAGDGGDGEGVGAPAAG